MNRVKIKFKFTLYACNNRSVFVQNVFEFFPVDIVSWKYIEESYFLHFIKLNLNSFV